MAWYDDYLAQARARNVYGVGRTRPPSKGQTDKKGQTDNQMERAAQARAQTPAPTPPSGGGSILGNIIAAAQAAAKKSGTGTGSDNTNPNAAPSGPPDYSQYSSGTGPNYAAELAEKKRQFDITTARDIAKQNATEVDQLQQRLMGLSGPKDAYADYFFSHGLMPPQGYKPGPVPLTSAQIDAYGKMGTTPQQLQTMISGNGQPGASTGMLGSLGQSLQTPAGMPQMQAAPAPTQPQTAANPTVQGGALYGKNPVPPATPGGVPSMAQGGQVQGNPGDASLAVVHGGEQIIPASGGAPQPPPGTQQSYDPAGQGIHPVIAGLIDAMNQLLSSPEFAPFVQGSLTNNQATPGQVPSMAQGGTIPGAPPGASVPPEVALARTGAQQVVAPQITSQTPQTPPTGTANIPKPSLDQMTQYRQTGRYAQPTPDLGGGMRDRAGGPTQGGSVGLPGDRRVNPSPSSSPSATRTSPIGLPQAGAQQVTYNTGAPGKPDNPIMPLANMDPYTRALYDVHGRLHPYSAQQQQEMGPQGIEAVNSYIGKVQGGDIKAYQDLVNRLKPQSGAPSASTGTAGEGFRFG